ncbi:unnamed protein product [Polarella glacialis]|uniref:N-acetyltransferase domain-containing protein n=1 Tax=Polarella glacialis TaxID=89957 RepID=A0A813INC8_POLGL|nr:unnamed protein product [Polarella glacialis]
MANLSVDVVTADYRNPEHARALELTLNWHAKDPCGGGAPLDQSILDKIVGELAQVPYAFSVLAFVDEKPAGLVNCFLGFSTFAAKPLVNIHDCFVMPEFRRCGVVNKMLLHVEAIARERGCCKLVLEVLAGNLPAKGAYLKFGFAGYELDPALGGAEFWQKKLALVPEVVSVGATEDDVTTAHVDYLDAESGQSLKLMLGRYAEDPCGGGEPLNQTILDTVVGELAQVPYAFSILAFVDGKPAGLVNCFLGFSTFAAKPLVNIHDCFVMPEFRRHGVGNKMLLHVEAIARERGCCKLVLEVLAGNLPAKGAYLKFGFAGYELDPALGGAEFWQKKLKPL